MCISQPYGIRIRKPLFGLNDKNEICMINLLKLTIHGTISKVSIINLVCMIKKGCSLISIVLKVRI